MGRTATETGRKAIGTEYTIRDAAGKPLCHSEGGGKWNADSRRKRAVRDAFRMMCEAAGSWQNTPAGELWLDVSTGAWLPMADETTSAKDFGKVERGHVIADAADGAFCPCNLVPQNKGANKGNQDDTLDPRFFVGQDPRTAWREVWLTHYAPKGKAARAV